MIVSIFGITSEEIIVFGSVSVNKKKTAGKRRSLASKKTANIRIRRSIDSKHKVKSIR